jgi:D-glycero-D-manno-heptose 1,7-bisphosphate phosphatase
LKKKALFLDRDGVINIDYNHVHKISEFHFVDGIFNFCKFFLNNGYIIVVVTNQAGIAKSFYTENDFFVLSEWMKDFLEMKLIKIEKIYFCPHHPDFTGPCNCRKPNPGMILKAKNDLNIDLKRSVLVGDKNSDIEAGLNAGIDFKNCHLFKGDFNIIQKQYE